MGNYYFAHNEVLKYWRIWILTDLNPEGNNAAYVFKGKTLENALKAAQKYCDKQNKNRPYQHSVVGEVLYECDYWGREVK